MKREDKQAPDSSGRCAQIQFSFAPAEITPRGDGSFIVKPGRPVAGPRRLTVDDAARELNANAQHVRDLIEEGEIEAVNIGTEKRKRWRICPTALQKFLRSRSSMHI
jgi:excisionase family DNA binding protein